MEKHIHSNTVVESTMYTSNDLPNLSYSSMLRATSQLCETIGSGSFENSFRSAMLFSSASSILKIKLNKRNKIKNTFQLIMKQTAPEVPAKIAIKN